MSKLQLEDDVEFQRREWRLERAGWAALSLFVIAAAAGAFGNGPLSHVTARADTGGLVVEYERFVRASAAARTLVRVRAIEDGEVTIWIDAPYLRDLDVSSIVPEPARVEHHGERVVYVFSSVNTTGTAEIVIRYEPARAGRLSGRIGSSNGSTAVVRQFAFF